MSNNLIQINELRSYLSSIFDHMENDLNLTHIEIDGGHNFFWEVPLDELFDVRNEKPALLMGSAQDSLDFVKESVQRGAKDSDAATLMLMHVLPLLSVILHKIRA